MNHSFVKPVFASIAFFSPMAATASAGDFCSTGTQAIQDNSSPTVVTIPVAAGASEQIESLSLDLTIMHDWVGDLVVTLESPSGTIITLLDRPGIPSTGFPGPFGCGGQDLIATFSDDASVAAESACTFGNTPVISGLVIPNMPMDTFATEPADGDWILSIQDQSAFDAGSLLQACLSITTSSACQPDLTGDGNLDFFDVSAFLTAFGNGDPVADFTGDTALDFFDVSAFLNAFALGCP